MRQRFAIAFETDARMTSERTRRHSRSIRHRRLILSKLLASVVTLSLVPLAVLWGQRQPQDQPSPKEQATIHQRAGADRPGRPQVADRTTAGTLRLHVLDDVTGLPMHCRVNVIGPDGNFYEPDVNPLKNWSLQRLGNREDKGPFRYYGWFFYCNGSVDVAVPPGKIEMEVWKGLEYAPQTVSTEVRRGVITEYTIRLRRAVDMAARGWYSGDTHIHLDRRNDVDTERALDLAAAEDIRFAHILCMNDPQTYFAAMERQIWPQNQGMGPKSERTRGIYGVTSGQEYRSNTLGHMCLIGGSRLADAQGSTNPNNWPPFGAVASDVRNLGGYSIHAHGGYEKEIYADFALGATDGVELLQFAVYRGIGLDGWYHILNAGYAFPAVGASDYPYCRALGDCRSYVYLGEAKPTFENWNRALMQGRSSFTTGPLLELTIDGAGPGDTVPLAGGKSRAQARVRMISPVAAVDELQLIEAGTITHRRPIQEAEQGKPVEWDVTIEINAPTWIAARATGTGPSGREDAEAHTNPIYLTVNNDRICRVESIDWLISKLDAETEQQRKREFQERDRILEYFAMARRALIDQRTRAVAKK